MNNKLKFSIAAITASAALLATMTLPVSAQITAPAGLTITATGSTTVGVRALGVKANASATVRTNLEAQEVMRANMEITNRINALNALETRTNGMVKLSGDEKTNLSSAIQTQITAMMTLQGQINADQSTNNTSSLKTDIQSITKTYRIYALILPQGEIAAASDRIMTITDAITTLGTTLQTRITAAQNAGANMSTSVSALADMNAKVADANTQATAAVNGTASLQPDNGNTTVAASNTAALKLARTDIQTAQKDLIAAQADAIKIIANIKASEKMTVTASTTVSASGTAQ